MTRYARFVDGRVIDIFDPSVYVPRPVWGETDAALMDKIFAEQKAAWLAAGAWFQAIPDDVEPGAYINQDGSFENISARNAREIAEQQVIVTDVVLE